MSMKKNKALVLVVMVAVVLLLSGCGLLEGEEHTHNLKCVMGDNPKLAFQYCTKCLRKVDIDDRY